MAAAAVVFAMLAACAPSTQPEISANAERDLAPYVQAMRTAAAGTDIKTLKSAVTSFDNEVVSLLNSGDLQPTRAQKLQDSSQALQTDFVALNKPTPSPSETPSSETPTPSETPTTPAPVVTVTVTPTVTPTETSTDTSTPGTTQKHSASPSATATH